MRKYILIIAILLLIVGAIISIYFLKSTSNDGFWIWGKENIDFPVTGQVGDFIGGVVGTAFALAGTLLIFLSFQEQTKQNKREAFESAFFEMVHLHRENVSQLNYTKFNGSKFETAQNREVFKLIFEEFLDCYREVKKFSNSKNINDYLLSKQIKQLNDIIKRNKLHVSILEMALIDIAYTIVFFGIGKEGEVILRDRFKRKYNHSYFYPLLRYINLKPKKEDGVRWNKWENLLALGYKDFKSVNEEFYAYRKHLSINNLSSEAQALVYQKEFERYYTGHQHRLGHYFRHLFQSYKYLNYHTDLTKDEKYFYGKTLRAQLSTYEQALLFINSLSTFGMKWDLTPEQNLLAQGEDYQNCKLITRYNLVKNLPGYHFFGLRYKAYYPNVKYETEE
jgi:hypothetical protein